MRGIPLENDEFDPQALIYLKQDGIDDFVTYSEPEQLRRFASERYDTVAMYTQAPFIPASKLKEVTLNPEFEKIVKATDELDLTDR